MVSTTKPVDFWHAGSHIYLKYVGMYVSTVLFWQWKVVFIWFIFFTWWTAERHQCGQAALRKAETNPWALEKPRVRIEVGHGREAGKPHSFPNTKQILNRQALMESIFYSVTLVRGPLQSLRAVAGPRLLPQTLTGSLQMFVWSGL